MNRPDRRARTRPHAIAGARLALLLGVLACGSLGCGGEEPSPRAPEPVGPPAGRDTKQVRAAFGEDGRAVLEEAEQVTLFTLNPVRVQDGRLSPETERFHGYGILGQAEIDDAAERRRLVEAVYEGLLGEGAGPASCFFPRHGLRFVRGGASFDLLICFECTWVHLFRDGAEHETRLLMGAGVKPVFDAAVSAHGLPQDGA